MPARAGGILINAAALKTPADDSPPGRAVV
jgi:hypothetical protein